MTAPRAECVHLQRASGAKTGASHPKPLPCVLTTQTAFVARFLRKKNSTKINTASFALKKSSTPLHPRQYMACSDIRTSTTPHHVEIEKHPKASNCGACRGVEDKSPSARDRGKDRADLSRPDILRSQASPANAYSVTLPLSSQRSAVRTINILAWIIPSDTRLCRSGHGFDTD